MKAERRHQLQDNTLAKVITKAPNWWQESGAKFLAIAVAVLVIVFLIRYRISSNREAEAGAVQNLATARTIIDEVQQQAMSSPLAPAQQQATQRRQLYNDANEAIGRALTLSDDKKIAAEALLAKADLAWELATLPAIPGAATQPTLQVRDPKELISNANEAYQTILNNYADQIYAAIAARFGLAALAENKRDFDAAKSQYEKLALETKDFPAYQQLAAERLKKLDELRHPVILATPATMPAIAASSMPTTQATQAMSIPPMIAAPKPATTQSVAAQTPPAAAATKPSTRP
jgi:hypothetical protein